MDTSREWYNGYNFMGEPVYNPFDILQFIDHDLILKIIGGKVVILLALLSYYKTGIIIFHN